MAKTVLTVDDSASIRQMVAFTLSSAGFWDYLDMLPRNSEDEEWEAFTRR